MPATYQRLARALVAALTLTAVAACGAQQTPTGAPSAAASPTMPATRAAATPPPSTAGQPAPARKQYTAPPNLTIDQSKTYTAVLHTSEGDITIELFVKDAPRTVNNFVFLAREKFYDGVKFHRIIKGFMVQTGDPKGDGTGGPGYRFNDEPIPDDKDYTPGIVAMANAGRNTNGSQFFIMHADRSGGRLPKNYVIFGKVADDASMAVVDKIASTPVRPHPLSGEPSQPTRDVTITSVDIVEK